MIRFVSDSRQVVVFSSISCTSMTIRLFRIISSPSKFSYFRLPDHGTWMDCKALDFRCQCTKQIFQSICPVLAFDRELSIFYERKISIKLFYLYQRLQCRDNCFFKIKLLSFIICCGQHHERKTICIYIFLISDR